MNIGTPELILAGVILLFLFGGRKLPELTRGIVEAIKEIKKSLKN
jgi:sec-independent protein translocase protein TatA